MVYPVIPDNQKAAYAATLNGPHIRRTRVALLDRRGQSLADMSHAFRDGNIVVDGDAAVSRLANIELLDPKHEYGFDADTYDGSALNLTRMLRIFWVVDGPLLAKPISVPVHTGPFVRLERTGALVHIEAQGKEVYGLGEAAKTITIRKGRYKTDAIKIILTQLMGETRMAIPSLAAKLTNDLVITRTQQPWKEAQNLAGSMGRQLYYDGAGTCYLRSLPARVSWTFKKGPGGNVTSPLTTSADLTQVINAVEVIGMTQPGKTTPVSWTAVAPATHQLAPANLGPPGSPVKYTKRIENAHLRTNAECKVVADRELKDGLRLLHDVGFTTLTVPHLDPFDLVHVSSDRASIDSRIHTFDLGLGPTGQMTVGNRHQYALGKATG